MTVLRNADPAVVEGFGKEWSHFDQSGAEQEELRQIFERYFAIFPKDALNPHAVGFDAGCGSGRWAAFVAPLVRELHCVDASDQALAVAKRNLSASPNVRFHHSSAGDMPLAENFVRMGVTTVVIGNCGGSALDVAKLFREVEATNVAINVATLIGHNTVRQKAMGGSFDRLPTPEELAKMKSLVEQAMKDGASARAEDGRRTAFKREETK